MLIQDLPKTCPRCAQPFSRNQRPYRKLQLKAVMLIWLGMLLVIPWAGLIMLMYHNSDTIIVPIGPLSTFLALAIVSSPAIGLGLVAMNLRKCADLKCIQCGWKQRYLVDKPERVSRP